MNSAKVLFLALLLAACSSGTIAAETPIPSPSPGNGDTSEGNGIFPTQEQEEFSLDEEIPAPTSIPEIIVQRTSWLLLGGDYRAHREGTGYGNKTDAIVLVSVLESDPIEITVIQFPRNLYVPTSLEDQWLFAVWGREGWQGLHQWFQEAMGVSLQGVFYIDMDQFEYLIDDLDGICVDACGGSTPVMASGAETLEFLRDNDNNWDQGSYDAGQRVFTVLAGMMGRLEQRLTLHDIRALWEHWGWLVDTDLSNVQQVYWLLDLVWKVISDADYEIDWVQLEESVIARGNTPLEVRGMIAAQDLRKWMSCTLDWKCEQ